MDVGNNGLLSDSGEYWTSEEDVERIFTSIAEKARNWAVPRILLYLHGGLNDERAVARRVVAFRDVLLANQIYPIHIMWETGFWETLKSIVLDQFTDRDERAGNWLSRFREGVLEARDRTIELTVAPAGRAIWDEMKENAQLASRRGSGMDVLVRGARRAIGKVADPTSWELHVVAHNAGSIFVAHALKELLGLSMNFRTIQLFAPAIRVDDFKQLVLPSLKTKGAPALSLYVLSDTGERDDDVGPYGKSLLYLVSNSFEGRRGTPLLGMETFGVGAERSSSGCVPQVEDRRTGDRRHLGKRRYAWIKVEERQPRRFRQRSGHAELDAVPHPGRETTTRVHGPPPAVLACGTGWPGGRLRSP